MVSDVNQVLMVRIICELLEQNKGNSLFFDLQFSAPY